MKIKWTEEALNKLNDIEEFIARDSPERAELFINFLIERAESIIQNPKRGRIVPEIQRSKIREIIEKNYRIVYKIEKNSIEILTLFEGHRLLREDEIES